jgi:hypothetical protein
MLNGDSRGYRILNPRLVTSLFISAAAGWLVAAIVVAMGAGLLAAYLISSLVGSVSLVAASLVTAVIEDRKLRATTVRVQSATAHA